MDARWAYPLSVGPAATKHSSTLPVNCRTTAAWRPEAPRYWSNVRHRRKHNLGRRLPKTTWEGDLGRRPGKATWKYQLSDTKLTRSADSQGSRTIFPRVCPCSSSSNAARTYRATRRLFVFDPHDRSASLAPKHVVACVIRELGYHDHEFHWLAAPSAATLLSCRQS